MPDTSEADAFRRLCRVLGFEPERVLSIRINRHKAVVTHSDSQGDLQSQTLLLPNGA